MTTHSARTVHQNLEPVGYKGSVEWPGEIWSGSVRAEVEGFGGCCGWLCELSTVSTSVIAVVVVAIV